MHTTFKMFSVIIFIMTVFTSCQKNLKGEGPMISESILVSDYNGISLHIPADLTVVIADSFNCIITAQENIIRAIECKEDGNVLEIDSDYDLETPQPVSIVVSLPSLERLQINGSGSAGFVNTVKGEELRLYINGSGDITAKAEVEELKSELNGSGSITLSGSAKLHSCIINGSGDLHTFDFSGDETDIEINGSGDAEVSVVSTLKVNVKGSGNVIYKGQPHIETEIMGSGEIKKAD